mmetsp:Transcript_6490/g.10287  ORF Transcript_6490/g.10287 Transcript_6490/m.10287 type:complete len:217 (-) Transcript_6490:151-801(-)
MELALDALNCGVVHHWFGQNAMSTHPRLTPVPIGIANAMWRHGNPNVVYSEGLKASSQESKIDWLYANFKVSKHAPGRALIQEQLSHLPFATLRSSPVGYREYIEELASHRFSASPRGNGVDTHRTWESLYVATLPLVEDSTFSRFFAGIQILNTSIVEHIVPGKLPLVLVQEWESVSESSLEQAWTLFLDHDWHWGLLDLKTWKDCIGKCVSSID